MAYSGTMVAAGRGTGVVTATGPATELGRISRMPLELHTLATPLTLLMKRFGKILSIVIVRLAVGVLAVFLPVGAGKAHFRRFGAAR
jgi:magnesium-transporting ATPase (P-type)